MSKTAKTTTSTGTAKVHFDLPGVRRIGPYRPLTVYEVPEKEAERLVRAKGFRRGEPPAAPAKQED